MQRANPADRADLLGAHQVFLKDIAQISRALDRVDSARESIRIAKLSLSGTISKLPAAEHWQAQAHQALIEIPNERYHIYKLLKARRLSGTELAFFTAYCHDSYAGFKPFENVLFRATRRNAPWESGGYLKFRTRYAGEDPRLSLLDPGSPDATRA